MILAQIIGFSAVALYLLSFQLKKRAQIVWVTCISNFLYVLQYVLLGAFSGAVLDIISAVSSFFAGKKHAPHFRTVSKVFAVLTLALIAISGVVISWIRRDPIQLIPIVGALLQTGSLWFDKEQTIRKLSLMGAPFWLVYNTISAAYGAAFGSALSIISAIVGLARYRRKKT